MSECDDEWLRPIDPMADSYAPEAMAEELGRRYALYLREAQRIVLEGHTPDEDGLTEGITTETSRYLERHPWLADSRLEPTVAEAEAAARVALSAIVRAAPPPPIAAIAPQEPVRRLALHPAATIMGTLAVRKKRVPSGVELSWNAEPSITGWVVRVSTRPDPRRPYVDEDARELAAATTSFEVALDDVPRRIQITGDGRDGRVVRRAVISALTSGNSGAQWKKQATAS